MRLCRSTLTYSRLRLVVYVKMDGYDGFIKTSRRRRRKKTEQFRERFANDASLDDDDDPDPMYSCRTSPPLTDQREEEDIKPSGPRGANTDQGGPRIIKGDKRTKGQHHHQSMADGFRALYVLCLGSYSKSL